MSRYPIALLLLALAALTSGCATSVSESDTNGEAAGGLRVVATSGPVGDAVRRVLGDHGTVEVLMGPGVDPHLYREKPADMRKLSDADVVFFNGLHFEAMHSTLEKLAEKQPVFAVAGRLEQQRDARLRYPEGVESLPDPHVWHDAALWSDCVGEIALRLDEVDPDHGADYQSAAEAYRAELAGLDAWCREQIATIPADRRVMVTAHDAFGYFSTAYGIETVGLKGVSTEDQIDLGRMQDVVSLVIEKKLPSVFVESSVAERVVEALIEPCRARGHEVRIGGKLFADALGDAASGADTYVKMMRANVGAIVSGLGGETAEPRKTAPAAEADAASP